MQFIKFKEVQSFLKNNDYDVKKTGNARWIDQKCTPDVLCIVSDFILDYIYNQECEYEWFKTIDIWYSDIAKNTVENIFQKPGVKDKKAKNEYDKFFQQPMELLSYAGILTKSKKGNANIYKVLRADILQFIAIRERKALKFLVTYIEEVLKDSGIYSKFNTFFKVQDKYTYQNVKKAFANFTIKYTNINRELECNRIFTKIINPLAFDKNLKGTYRGRISKNIISYDELMYNRDNFRDIFMEKPKNMTRQEFIIKENIEINTEYSEYQIARAKKILKRYNDKYRNGFSEYKESGEDDVPAIHIHHIFPKSAYPEIAAYIENLISITPNQHYIKAHNKGRTDEINRDYQYLLLLAKTDIIRDNLKTENIIYDIQDYKYVLSVGFNDEKLLDLENNFKSIKDSIDSYYN